MTLDDLLAVLASRAADTSATSTAPAGVSAKPLLEPGCTHETLDTPPPRDLPEELRKDSGPVAPARHQVELDDPEIAVLTWHDTDLRCCALCLNRLPNGICKVAAPGGPVSANRGYRPERLRLRRCEGYRPCPDDPDQRLGRERWPGLDATWPQHCIAGEEDHDKV